MSLMFHLLPQGAHEELDLATIELFKNTYQEIYSARHVVLSTSKILRKLEILPKVKRIQVINRRNQATFYEVTTTVANIALTFVDDLSELTDESKTIFQVLTVKAGAHFDLPDSVKSIPRFINTYEINMREFEEANYTCFNDFFARKIKLNFRPMPPNPDAFLSAADCRCIVFTKFIDAVDVWIKGNKFSISNLLCRLDWSVEFANSCIIIFRLAPDDYHRWHFPFSGTLTSISYIDGSYYTVNPKAVNSSINVFTENHRIVRIFDTQFGRIAEISIGALLVGSIVIHHQEIGTGVRRGEDAGYFKYGGSTVIYLILNDRIALDQDLLLNSKIKKMETYVKAREQIGRFH
eukprot:NODE_177_length_15815_cov_0.395457.p6 type:complete len:350 gc:universal NODE_177_length_15815_cov_0.395457:1765-716(-)